MGRMIIGTPSKGEIIASRVCLVLLCLVVVCGIIYRNTQSYMAKGFRDSNTSGAAEAYLLKFPDGKYVQEAVDTIYSYYNGSCETFYIKDYGEKDTVSHIPYLIEVRDRLRKIHPLAGNAIDSLITRRAFIEYEKAKAEDTVDAWRLYYRVIPSEYRIDK